MSPSEMRPSSPPAAGREGLPWPARAARPPGGVVYGPVASRRLGRSLGVDLTPPGSRVCSFECVYCDVPEPWSDPDATAWPTPRGVGEALEAALHRCGELDSITISGHGEPTLHPELEEVVEHVLAVARRDGRRTPIRILTNGSGAVRSAVRGALDRLDERIVTLDAAPLEVDRPRPDAPLGGVLHALALLRDVTAQSCFVEGAVSNATDRAVAEWTEILDGVRPRSAQIYTPSRRPRRAGLRPVPPVRLHEIGRRLHECTGIPAEVFA